MTKAYLTRWTRRTTPGEEHKSDFCFDPDPEKALYWETKEQATIDRDTINQHMNVEIDGPDGNKHSCRTFEVEERTPNKYVIFCMLPWSPRTA